MKQFQQLVNINEFKESIIDTGKIEEYFSTNEIALYYRKNAVQGLAARWAAKKCLIEDLHLEIPFNKIEILNNGNGKPFLKCLTDENCLASIFISLSHTHEYAAALIVNDANSL